MASDPGTDLAETFAQIARRLIAETNLHATIQRIVYLAVEIIDTFDVLSGGCHFEGLERVLQLVVITRHYDT